MPMLPMIAAAAMSAVYPQAAPYSLPSVGCPSIPSGFNADAEAPGILRRLDTLPDTKEFLAVYRNVDGCSVPLVAGVDNQVQR